MQPANDVNANDINAMDRPDEKDLSENPRIWSLSQPVNEYSFIDERQAFNPLAPPPKYFTPDFIRQGFELSMPTDAASILNNFTQPEQGGLICTNEEALNKQKGILSHVAKEAVKLAMAGKGIAHISLPIKIFEPRSSIHRMADLWTFAP